MQNPFIPEYRPDSIVIRAASVRAEKLADDTFVIQLRAEIAERNAAANGDFAAQRNYRPDLLMGTLLATADHACNDVYGLLLVLSEETPVLPSDRHILTMARTCFLHVEKQLLLPYEKGSLLRASQPDPLDFLRPVSGPGVDRPEELLRPNDNLPP